jgi:predicted Zn-dependent protease
MIKAHWQRLTSQILSEIRPPETLTLGLSGESSLFLRFNNSKIRQMTDLEQHFLEFTFQKNHRQIKFTVSLSGNLETDFSMAKALLSRAREEIQALPEDPHAVPIENHGTSDQEINGHLPSAKEAIEAIEEAHKGIDHSGFYSGGPIYRASRNSLGQDHWFSSNSFFYDYSLFTVNADGANKAAKGCYSERGWDPKNLSHNIAQNNELLRPLKRANKTLQPGSYRAYLAPGAVSEIASILNWGACDYASLKQGKSAFAKLADGRERLSPLMSFGENFELGLAPRFNSLGELSSMSVPVIENGILKNWLVSSRAAKEYAVSGNASEGSFRSLEILPGVLLEDDAIKELGTGVYLENLHYLNWSDLPNARVTGMTRYACFWVENGEIVAPIQDMRFDESLYRIFGSELLALTKESYVEPNTMTYARRELGGSKLPGVLLKDFRLKM